MWVQIDKGKLTMNFEDIYASAKRFETKRVSRGTLSLSLLEFQKIVSDARDYEINGLVQITDDHRVYDSDTGQRLTDSFGFSKVK